MSRSTQYIGLNRFAREYIEPAIKVESVMLGEDPFGGPPVTGGRFYLEPPEGFKEYYMEEVVQAEPWSSGPMIFTCLKRVLIRENGERNEGEKGDECFRWMEDPSLSDRHIEYDYETGRFWV